jgi:hypothetical protein
MMKRRANGEETLAEIARFYNVNFMVQRSTAWTEFL